MEQTQNKNEKPVGSGKIISEKFTELVIFPDEIIDAIRIAKGSGRKFVVLKLVKRKEVGKYGDTHVIYKPDQIVNNE